MPNLNDSLDLVTGAFSYSGARIAEQLLAQGHRVRTLTFHPDRPSPLQGRVDARRYRFDDAAAMTRDLESVETLYNTYWIRFEDGSARFEDAVRNSRRLFEAARRAGVRRIVHVSITNPSPASTLPYFRGKALVEQALAETGVSYSIVRPTWIFGGPHEILANNIAWILRHVPVFAIPGNGAYPVQPVHVDDLADICCQAARAEADLTIDAAGPETMSFKELVHAIRQAVGSRARIVPVPPVAMAALSRCLGLLVRDTVLTTDEIRGLTAGLLVSNEPPRGHIALSEWLGSAGGSLGRSYANELKRHFRV